MPKSLPFEEKGVRSHQKNQRTARPNLKFPPIAKEREGGNFGPQSRAGNFKRVIVTPAVYPRLDESLHFDIQSTGQKSHCIKTT